MEIYIPSQQNKKSTKKLQEKILKENIVEGIFSGYDLTKNTIVSLKRGFNGWNMFINPNYTELLTETLKYILKNKKSILFLMKESGDNEINFIIKNN